MSKKIFTRTKEQSDEDDETYSKDEIKEDLKNILTDSRLIHILSDILEELRVKRASTRSDEKRRQYDDEILKLSEDRGRLHDRINHITNKYF